MVALGSLLMSSDPAATSSVPRSPQLPSQRGPKPRGSRKDKTSLREAASLGLACGHRSFMKTALESENQAALDFLCIKKSAGYGCGGYHCSGTRVSQEGPAWPRGCGLDPHTQLLLCYEGGGPRAGREAAFGPQQGLSTQLKP